MLESAIMSENEGLSSDVIDRLNPKQKQAVTHVGGPLLLVAGAGSGKTMVITCRIAHLIQSGQAKPWEILGVTFTNKAAVEMKDRVRRLTDQDVLISTFHSLGARILRQHGDVLDLKEGFVIYDVADQTTLVKECLKVLNMSTDKFKPSAVVGQLGRLKDELIDPKTYENFASGPYEKIISQLYHLYEERLKENNAVDFSDLIMRTVQLFGTDKKLLNHYQERFRFLLVDEYQDTNYGQYQLVKLLADKHHNVCVVGDPDQSIYSWRGADIRNILNFEQDYPQTTVISLEENYRSTQNILDVANQVIANNVNRKPKNLRTSRGPEEKIRYFQASDGRDEADFVVQQICEQRASGVAMAEMAVLYRVHALSRSLEEAFIREQVPYKILGGVKFYDRKEVKDLLAYLRFIVNPADRISFNRIVNVPKRGVGPSTVAKIQDFAYEKQISFAEALNMCDSIPSLTTRTLNKIRPFVSMIASFRRDLEVKNPGEILQDLVDHIEYLDYLKMDDPVSYTTRHDNIKELFAAMAEYEQRTPDGDLQGYLEEVALLTDLQNQQSQDEVIVLMTIHNAKGLEYDVCFLVGFEEGLFPYGATDKSEDELEEERRLCYVGITRTKNLLYITSAMRRLMYGRWKSSIESRFLSEIPKELLACVGGSRLLSYDDAISSGKSGDDLYPLESQVRQVSEFYVGQQVFHETWGEGQVVATEGSEEHLRLKVRFSGGLGVKNLMAKYANLSTFS